MAHQHVWIVKGIQRAPIGPAPAHTEFTVLGCMCGAFSVWPESNYGLVLPDWRADFEQVVREAGGVFIRESAARH